MLKIKDNINLKELKKFGFKYDKKTKTYYKKCLGTFNKFIVATEDDEDVCRGQIVFLNESNFQATLYLDVLYDLIEKGLVEKIREE